MRRADRTVAGVAVDGTAVPLLTDAEGHLEAEIAAGDENIGNVDVVSVPADPFGTNADAAVAAGAAGSIQAKLRRLTQQLDDLKTDIVLAAGTNNIGDVDIASIAAGTNRIGSVSLAPSETVLAGTQAATLAAAALNSGVTLACSEVCVQNDPTSASNLLVGNGTSQPFVLRPGESLSLPADDVAAVFVKIAAGSSTVNWIGVS